MANATAGTTTTTTTTTSTSTDHVATRALALLAAGADWDQAWAAAQQEHATSATTMHPALPAAALATPAQLATLPARQVAAAAKVPALCATFAPDRGAGLTLVHHSQHMGTCAAGKPALVVTVSLADKAGAIVVHRVLRVAAGGGYALLNPAKLKAPTVPSGMEIHGQSWPFKWPTMGTATSPVAAPAA